MAKIELRRLVDGKYSVIGLDGKEKYILQPMGRTQAEDVERALNAIATDYLAGLATFANFTGHQLHLIIQRLVYLEQRAEIEQRRSSPSRAESTEPPT